MLSSLLSIISIIFTIAYADIDVRGIAVLKGNFNNNPVNGTILFEQNVI